MSKSWEEIEGLSDYESLRNIVDAGLSQRQIAHILHCSRYSVQSAMEAHGLKRGIVVLKGDGGEEE